MKSIVALLLLLLLAGFWAARDLSLPPGPNAAFFETGLGDPADRLIRGARRAKSFVLSFGRDL